MSGTRNGGPTKRLAGVIAAFAGLALPLAPLAAQDDAWRQASRTGDQTAFVDMSSTVRDGDKVRFWREIRSAEPRTLEGGDERYDKLGSLIEADCQRMEFRTLELYIKLGDEEVARGTPEAKLEIAKPGSTVETDIKTACSSGW